MGVETFLASDIPAKIRSGLNDLILHNEASTDCEGHNFAGFCLPDLDLRGGQFSKPVFFNHAEFLGNVVLSEAKFESKVDFAHAEFHGELDVLSMSFLRGVEFEWARFRKDVLFSDSRIEGEVDFSDAVIDADLTFEGDISTVGTVFSRVKIRKDGRLIFSGTDLSRARFWDLNLERVEFHDVKWFRPPRSRWLGNRNALSEEFDRNNSEMTQPRTAECYRQLVLNFERNRDFDSAEDFHVGEMEMRRKMHEQRVQNPFLKFFWKRLNSYNVYRLLSRYGTSYATALSWLLTLVFVVFPVLFMWFGFVIFDADSGRLIQAVRHEGIAEIRNGTPWIWDWFHSVAFSVSVATFQHSKHFEPLGASTIVLSGGESLMVTGLTALILFAVRRRFRR